MVTQEFMVSGPKTEAIVNSPAKPPVTPPSGCVKLVVQKKEVILHLLNIAEQNGYCSRAWRILQNNNI